MANLGKSKIWYQNSDISSSIFKTCSVFPSVGGIYPKKNRVYIDIFILGEILLSVLVLANNY